MAVRWSAAIRASDGHECTATLANVSADGFCLQGVEDLVVGERIHVRVGKAQTALATIRWVRGQEAGATFDAPPELNL